MSAISSTCNNVSDVTTQSCHHPPAVPTTKGQNTIPVLFYTLAAAVALLLCTSTTLAADPQPQKLPFTLSKETTAITSPLRPDGTPDYVAALNEKYGKGVTPENNALLPWIQIVGTDMFAPISRKASFELIGFKDLPFNKTLFESFETYLQRTKPEKADKAREILTDARKHLWTPDEYPELAAYLEAQREPLAAMPAAVARERWWIPCVVEREGTLIWTILPALSPLRDAAETLCARATLQARAGRWQNALADLHTASRIAAHTGTGFTLMERVIALAPTQSVTESAGAIAASGTLSAQQCRELADQLAKEAPPASIADVIDVGERFTMDSSIITIATGHLERFKPEVETHDDTADFLKVLYKGMTIIQTERVDWDSVLRLNNELLDQQVRALRAPSFSRMTQLFKEPNTRLEEMKRIDREALEELGAIHLVDTPELRAQYNDLAGRTIVAILAIETEKAGTIRFRVLLQQEMLRTLIAAAEVKAGTGHWPESLDALNAAKGIAIPRDMYSPEERDPIHYRLTPQGPVLYSIGPNQRDDQGIRDADLKRDDISIGVVPSN